MPVLSPVVEHGRYDLAFEIGGRSCACQCKSGAARCIAPRAASSQVNLTSARCTPQGYGHASYLDGEIDLPWRSIAGTGPLLPSAERWRSGAERSAAVAPPRNCADERPLILPQIRVPRGCSSAGRASRWQREGQGFEPPQLHSLFRRRRARRRRLPRVPQPLRLLPRARCRGRRHRGQPAGQAVRAAGTGGAAVTPPIAPAPLPTAARAGSTRAPPA